MADWHFRITSGLASDFAADLNALMVANGFPAAMPSNWTGTQSVVIDDITRLDFDTFTMPSGLHVNARMTTLPGADPTKAAQVASFWPAAIAAWFGQGGTQPVCPTLTTLLNPTLGAAYPLQVGGQSWKSTGKTVLIDPAPAHPMRVWA